MPKLSDSQQEERRTRLLDAAEICFARHGFHRTTMQDICKEARVSAGAVYTYFPSKEALIEGFSARERAQVLAAFERAGDASDFSESLVRLMQECVLDKPRYKSTLWLEIGAEATRNPAVAETQQACERQIRAALIAMLERAQNEGRIAPAMPVTHIVAAMEIVAEGMFFRRAVDPVFDAAAAGETALAMISCLIRPQTPAAAPAAPSGHAVPETVR